MQYPFHWLENDTASISVTATTAFSAFAAPPPTGRFQIRIVNAGAKTGFIRKSGPAGANAALVTDLPVLAGTVEVLTINHDDRSTVAGLSAICGGTDSTTLYFTVGAGI